MMKKIAVVGAGFSGLALCYYLQGQGREITLFDCNGIGGGASGIASGLLHPYPGESARLSWRAEEGMAASRELLQVVGKEVYKETGILRLALNKTQEEIFQKRALEREDVEWWDAEQCHQLMPGSHYLPGIFIHSGITVHTSLYLQGLWAVCEREGVHFEKKKVLIEDLINFDQVVLATGGGIRAFPFLSQLNLKFNKGQVLLCKKPQYWTKENSIIGKGYIALSEEKERCYLGSTYEHTFLTETPCLGIATELIFKQIRQFLSALSAFEVLGCKAEIRVTNRKSYLPCIGQVTERIFVITALGSRGLLYHAYLGKILADAMLSGGTIPEEVSI